MARPKMDDEGTTPSGDELRGRSTQATATKARPPSNRGGGRVPVPHPTGDAGADLVPPTHVADDEKSTRRYWVGVLPHSPQKPVHLKVGEGRSITFPYYLSPEEPDDSDIGVTRTLLWGDLVELSEDDIDGLREAAKKVYFRAGRSQTVDTRRGPNPMRSNDLPVAECIYIVRSDFRRATSKRDLPAALYATGVTWEG